MFWLLWEDFQSVKFPQAFLILFLKEFLALFTCSFKKSSLMFNYGVCVCVFYLSHEKQSTNFAGVLRRKEEKKSPLLYFKTFK